RSESVELPSKAAATRAPQLCRLDPHRKTSWDSRAAHPRIDCTTRGGQEARSEIGTPGSSSHVGGAAQRRNRGDARSGDAVRVGGGAFGTTGLVLYGAPDRQHHPFAAEVRRERDGPRHERDKGSTEMANQHQLHYPG